MALAEIELDLSPVVLPDPVAELIAEADRRIDDFFETEENKRFPRFIPSNTRHHFTALDFVTRNNLTLGEVYCEWGSGFGVGTCLASLLGYQSIGIEIEPELVELSDQLAGDLNIPVETICTSYIPEGFDSYDGIGGEVLIEPVGFASDGRPESAPFYEGMEIPLDEVDLYYVYPRPDQQEFMLNMFDAVAGEGAMLLANYENGEICGYRRTFED